MTLTSLLENMAIACLIFAIIGIIIAIPGMMMEWLNNKTGWMDRVSDYLFGEDR